MTEEALKDLLLKDGEIFKYSSKDKILSDDDLDILCDRSDAAYDRASRGLGNSNGYKVVETKVGGLMETMDTSEKQ
jgi:ATP-dependent DNA helicase